MDPLLPYKGRGAGINPPNRFEEIRLERDEEWGAEDDPAPRTKFYHDLSQSIISTNDSPDVGGASLNPYRGCEHGCIYCFARPTHEYLGLSAGLDFESKIFVKMDAPALLRRALESKSWKPQPLMTSGVTDCYQPVERRLKITRGCLEVMTEFRQPVGIITKNLLVTRDIDLLQQLAAYDAARVTVSLTSLRDDLIAVMEPRTARPSARLATIERLSRAGIPVNVNVAPIIPGLTDSEMPTILKAARDAGARFAGFTLVRLPWAVKDLFEKWLGDHWPLAKDKILHRIRETRGGKLYDSRFGIRMTGEGPYAKQIAEFFELWRKRYRFETPAPLSTQWFRRPSGAQLEFFS